MVKKEKAFYMAPRSLFDLVATNDLSQLSISVKGINPHDSSPGSLVLSSKQRPLTSDGMSTLGTAARGLVGSITASMVAFERDEGGFTALHIAAAYGHLEMVKVLTEEYHCSIVALSDSGKSPLYVAVENGQADVVRYFLEQGGNDLRIVTTDEQKTLFTVSLEKQHHQITVVLDAALEQSGYDSSSLDPIEAALQGDLFYFALEKARMEASLHSSTNQAAGPFSRIVFAVDPLKNSILASISSQIALTDKQIEVAKFLIRHRLCGDMNVVNSSKCTALHNLALGCGEKVLEVDALTRRVDLLQLLLQHGADPRRVNGAGNTATQCTENPVFKLFLSAAEKRAVFQEMYVRRNQIPYAERQTFAAACKELKKAYRVADVMAAKALQDPVAAAAAAAAGAAATSSAQSSPKTSARGPAKASVNLQIVEAKNLPARQVEGADAVMLDAFVTVMHQNVVVYQSSVAPSSSNPLWENAAVDLQVAMGDVVEIRVEDKELPSAPAPAPIGSVTITVDQAFASGCENELPLSGVEGATLRFKSTPL